VSVSTSDRRRLLLVDDCVPQRELYELALEHEFDILTASRGAEGIDVALRARPDAILLDVLMPGMDGWETCTRIRCDAEIADIPVILLTAADDRDLSQHAVAVGASALLRKPCSVDQLRDTIEKVIGR
jgi:two-component system, cell cycle response regulator